MIIKMLFGQMKERYEGEHAPELICAVDEYTIEMNPDCWETEKRRALAGSYETNFISLKEVEIEVDQDRIREILLANPVIKGTIIENSGLVPE